MSEVVEQYAVQLQQLNEEKEHYKKAYEKLFVKSKAGPVPCGSTEAVFLAIFKLDTLHSLHSFVYSIVLTEDKLLSLCR